ncbi:hypothetical protein UFOVP613_14 [uncultured Caudovirales phage]|uniref:Uncharacterized protein n=1 Tax=uncultured Caudovirales phage TaxID=2100421 RepID=A0A6J5N589_9CAUD|nr:hypothetical protein UFOVP613_14 [uncultured Caudovirales phage]
MAEIRNTYHLGHPARSNTMCANGDCYWDQCECDTHEHKPDKRGVDFRIVDGGSVLLLMPETDAGRAWADEHLPEDALTLGAGIAIERRYMGDIIAGIVEDGLGVEGVNRE